MKKIGGTKFNLSILSVHQTDKKVNLRNKRNTFAASDWIALKQK